MIQSLAREGGLQSTLWAGPEAFSRSIVRGDHPVQGGDSQGTQCGSGSVSPVTSSATRSISACRRPASGAFGHDPEIKRECVWTGATLRPSAVLVDRHGPLVKAREDKTSGRIITHALATFDSIMTHCADPRNTPEMLMLREDMRAWRFYDHFRTDGPLLHACRRSAPTRRCSATTGTMSPRRCRRSAKSATPSCWTDRSKTPFPARSVSIDYGGGRFELEMQQHGLLRPLKGAELSDGTLRYLLWIAALLTPRPPGLLVLNEPETSLHPDLLPALGRLIAQASERTAGHRRLARAAAHRRAAVAARVPVHHPREAIE